MLVSKLPERTWLYEDAMLSRERCASWRWFILGDHYAPGCIMDRKEHHSWTNRQWHLAGLSQEYHSEISSILVQINSMILYGGLHGI